LSILFQALNAFSRGNLKIAFIAPISIFIYDKGKLSN
jgi:hypothetical protein